MSNIVDKQVQAEGPVVNPKEKLAVYVPVTDGENAGIASFDTDTFNVVKGKVGIREEYVHEKVDRVISDLLYELSSDGTYYICKGIGQFDKQSKIIVIASMYKGLPVKEVYRISSSYVEEVFIPDTVTSIGDMAFMGCISLKKIHFSKALTSIGSNAFHGCESLEDVEIPNSVQTMDYGIFARCNSLKRLSIPFTGYSRTSDKPFDILFSDDFDDVPGGIVPNSLKEVIISDNSYIPEECFFNNDSCIETIVLSDEIHSLSNNTFLNCFNLKNVILSKNITSLPSYCFASCTSLQTLDVSNIEAVGDFCFQGCTSLQTLTFTDKLVSIGSNAFSHCKIASLTIPYSVKTIGADAFRYCNSLTDVKLPWNEQKSKQMGAPWGAPKGLSIFKYMASPDKYPDNVIVSEKNTSQYVNTDIDFNKNVKIHGNLDVDGEYTSTEVQSLIVYNKFIICNAGITSTRTMSGIVIRTGPVIITGDVNVYSAYGIIYDPDGDVVRLGEGFVTDIDEIMQGGTEDKYNPTFTFGTFSYDTWEKTYTEGQAISTRSDSKEMKHGNLVKWDADMNKMVDSGVTSSYLSQNYDEFYKAVYDGFIKAFIGNIKKGNFVTVDDTGKKIIDSGYVPKVGVVGDSVVIRNETGTVFGNDAVGSRNALMTVVGVQKALSFRYVDSYTSNKMSYQYKDGHFVAKGWLSNDTYSGEITDLPHTLPEDDKKHQDDWAQRIINATDSNKTLTLKGALKYKNSIKDAYTYVFFCTDKATINAANTKNGDLSISVKPYSSIYINNVYSEANPIRIYIT